MNTSNIQQSQKLPPVIEALAAKARESGMTQKRSGGQCDGMDDRGAQAQSRISDNTNI
jgi:hypothetical protein